MIAALWHWFLVSCLQWDEFGGYEQVDWPIGIFNVPRVFKRIDVKAIDVQPFKYDIKKSKVMGPTFGEGTNIFDATFAVIDSTESLPFP